VRDVMGQLNIKSFTDANGQLMNLSQIVGILQSKGITAAQSLKMFGDAAGPGMFALVKAGQPALDALTQKLEHSNGAAKAMADQMMKGLPGAFEQLRGSLETAGISISKTLEPALVGVLNALTAVANFVSSTVIPAFAGPAVYAVGTIVEAGSSILTLSKMLPAGTTLVSGFATAFGLLAKAISIAGAAFVGWEIGKWLDKGGSTSDVLGQAMASVAETLHILPKGSTEAFGGMVKARIAANAPKMGPPMPTPEELDANDIKNQMAAARKELAKQLHGGGAAADALSKHDLSFLADLSGDDELKKAQLMASQFSAADVAGFSAEKQVKIFDIVQAATKTEAFAKLSTAAKVPILGLARATMEAATAAGHYGSKIEITSDALADINRVLGPSAHYWAEMDLEFAKAADAASKIPQAVPGWIKELPTAEESVANIGTVAGLTADELARMSAMQPPAWWKQFTDVHGLQVIAGAFHDLANSIGGSAGQIMAGIGGVVGAYGSLKQNGAQTGMVDKIGAIASGAGNVWAATGGDSKAGKMIGGAASGAMAGMAIGAAWGSAVPILGTAIGAGVGLAVGFIRSRMVSKQEKDARAEALKFQDQLLEKFAATATAGQIAEAQGERWRAVNISVRDAYLAIGKSEADAMKDLAAFNDATRQNADAVDAAAARIQQAFDEQAADAERLNKAIQTYGFSFAELGKQFQQNDLNAQSKELIEDWRVLVASGINMAVVNDHMADAMNQYLQSALAVGADVPAAMAPILKSFADQGLLVDSAGNKITDLNAAGVVFAETMTQGFDRVIVKLDQLIQSLIAAGTAIDPISGGTVAQAVAAGQSTPTAPSVSPSADASPTGLLARLRNRVPAMASGGIVRRPTFAMIGEAGPEAVVPLSGAGGFGGTTIIIHGDVYGYDDFNEKVARGYHAKIEQGGQHRTDARRLGLVS